MRKERLKYLGLVILTIILGLLSRKISLMPLCTGDMLWAVMIFFVVKFLFVKSELKVILIFSLFICYAVEISQLYQANWINDIRSTLIGRLVLGQGFLISDLFAYTFGIFIASIIDSKIIK